MAISQMILIFLLTISDSNNEWHSGGGVLANNRDNPWFLNSQEPISYCIDIDEDHFGTTQQQAELAFEAAAEYWSHQFLNQDSDHLHKVHAIHLPFQYHCSNQTHIKLQLGVLDESQKKHIPQPQNVIATTIRTDYNNRDLLGKGFIYISPEDGPLALNSTESVKKPWSRRNSAALRVVFMHELGHMYGLQHFQTTNSIDRLDLMHPSLPRAALGINSQAKQKGLTPQNISDAIIRRNFSGFFRFLTEGQSKVCGSEANKFNKFFDWPQSSDCTLLKWNHDQVHFFALDTEKNRTLQIYSSKVRKIHWKSFSETLLKIGPEQRVFPVFQSEENSEIPILQRYSAVLVLPQHTITFEENGSITFGGLQKDGLINPHAIELPLEDEITKNSEETAGNKQCHDEMIQLFPRNP